VIAVTGRRIGGLLVDHEILGARAQDASGARHVGGEIRQHARMIC
jgi:hypothetical protein